MKANQKHKTIKPKQAKAAIDRETARKYKCDLKTASRWRLDNGPVGDPVAMRGWLANRWHRPAGTEKMLTASRSAESVEATKVSASSEGELGAAACLARLERGEYRAACELAEAEKTGDPVAVSRANKVWQTRSLTLLRYDIQVEQSRRTGQDQLSRDTVEDLIYKLTASLKYAWGAVVQQGAPNFVGLREPDQAARELERCWSIMSSAIVSGLRLGWRETPVPKWFQQAFEQDFVDGNREPEKFYWTETFGAFARALLSLPPEAPAPEEVLSIVEQARVDAAAAVKRFAQFKTDLYPDIQRNAEALVQRLHEIEGAQGKSE